jgi:hypothetical protein
LSAGPRKSPPAANTGVNSRADCGSEIAEIKQPEMFTVRTWFSYCSMRTEDCIRSSLRLHQWTIIHTTATIIHINSSSFSYHFFFLPFRVSISHLISYFYSSPSFISKYTNTNIKMKASIISSTLALCGLAFAAPSQRRQTSNTGILQLEIAPEAFTQNTPITFDGTKVPIPVPVLRIAVGTTTPVSCTAFLVDGTVPFSDKQNLDFASLTSVIAVSCLANNAGSGSGQTNLAHLTLEEIDDVASTTDITIGVGPVPINRSLIQILVDSKVPVICSAFVGNTVIGMFTEGNQGQQLDLPAPTQISAVSCDVRAADMMIPAL